MTFKLIPEASNIVLAINASQSYTPKNYIASYISGGRIIPPVVQSNKFQCCSVKPCQIKRNLRR